MRKLASILISTSPQRDRGQTSNKNAEDGGAVTTTARKLARMLNTGSTESSEDSLIWPSRRKRRRLSISRSKAAAQVPTKEPKAGAWGGGGGGGGDRAGGGRGCRGGTHRATVGKESAGEGGVGLATLGTPVAGHERRSNE